LPEVPPRFPQNLEPYSLAFHALQKKIIYPK